MVKQTEKQEKRLPAWRIALAIVLATAATALLIYGSVILTTRAALSKRVIQSVFSKMDLLEEYGDTATKALNIGISHLTNKPYQPDKYVKKDQLRSMIDQNTVKTFLVDEIYEHASAVVDDEEAVLDSAEIVPLLSPIKSYVEKEYEISLTEEEIRSEIAKAIGHDRYITSREKTNTEIAKTFDQDPEKFDALHFFSPGRATACTIAGAVLLLGVYGVAWPKIRFAGFLCVTSCIVLCVVLLLIGILIRSMLHIDVTALLFDIKILQLWISKGSALFIRRAFLSLLGCIAPIALSAVYAYDRKHVKRIWRQPVATDK